MEFYRDITLAPVTSQTLAEKFTIGNLSGMCASIDKVIRDEGNTGVVYCVWGEFIVNRERLKHGVRFSLPTCPNALQFTLTTDNNDGQVVIHCTINKRKHDADFIASIEKLMDDLCNGLRLAFA
jgi:hypothetical protein